jgi:Na+/H+ antiporter NhaA
MAAATQTAARGRIAAVLVAPARRFLRTEAGSAGLLLAATVVALVWANSPWAASYDTFWHTALSLQVGEHVLTTDVRQVVDDGLMVLFFFIIGLEVRREFSLGELSDARRALVPTVAGIAGMLVPAALFLLLAPGGEATHGWGVVIGTDTAFLLGALALVGPSCSNQLRVFLLTLTVIDDIVAVSIIGVAYSSALQWQALVVAVACLVVLGLLSRRGAWRASGYLMVFFVLWWATVAAGLHASIAGMAAGLLIGARAPDRPHVEGFANLARRFQQSPLPEVGRSARQGLVRAVSVNERLQISLHPWTSYLVVPLFALANAGVDLRGGLLGDALRSPLTWAVVVGLVVGKLVGISAGALGAVRLGLGRLPQGVGSGQVMGGAALSGIGFTVALLIIGLAFDDPVLRDQATVGVLIALVLSAALGWLIFWAAARFHGERTAGLPVVLDRPVDPAADHIRGRPEAPLTLVEYGDFECPFCGRATGVVHELRERFGDDLRYVFRHLPLVDVHPHAELAAFASEAAAAQDRFWDMHDLLFAHQGELEIEDLAGYAGRLGLDIEQFLRDLGSDEVANRVSGDAASAEASGARGTPTFFVGDRRHVGPFDAESLAVELAHDL